MTIRRVVPNIKSDRLDQSREFYVDFLGLQMAMDMGFIIAFASATNPTAQISVIRDGSSAAPPHLTVEVSDVDEVYARALGRSELLRGRSERRRPQHHEPRPTHRLHVSR